MRSGWVDRDAQATIDHYAAQGVGRDLALRVYTTRLLGRVPTLVLLLSNHLDRLDGHRLVLVALQLRPEH